MKKRYGVFRKIENTENYEHLIDKEDEQSIFFLLENIIYEYIRKIGVRIFYDLLDTDRAEEYYPLINKTEEEKIEFYYSKIGFEVRDWDNISDRQIVKFSEKGHKEYIIIFSLYEWNNIADYYDSIDIKHLVQHLSSIAREHFSDKCSSNLYFIRKRYEGLKSFLKRYIRESDPKNITVESVIRYLIKKFIYYFEGNRFMSFNIDYDTQQLFEKKLLDLFKSNFVVAKKMYVKKLLEVLEKFNEKEEYKGLWTEDLLNMVQEHIRNDKDFINDINVEVTSLLDYSDTNDVQKIIFLYKTGVLDFLKNKEPFITSTNALAEYLSGVTGVKVSTVQSYINPIFNKNVKQSKSALNNKTTINKVEQKLIKIGYKLDDLFT